MQEGMGKEEQRTHGNFSDVWLPSGSLIKTVTVTKIRARKARAGGGVSKDAVDRAAISATTRSQGLFGSSAI